MTRIGELTAESIALLKDMIAIPSLSFEEDAVCAYICKWMESKGVSYDRVGNNIICRNNPGSSSRLLLCAHIDTVRHRRIIALIHTLQITRPLLR